MSKKYHFVGIGGIGMSGLARILLNKKDEVSGSDVSRNTMTDLLEHEGAKISFQHHESNIHKEMTVVYSSSISEENPERQMAQKYACTVLHRSELLQHMMEGSQPLIVTGSHGKTTTSCLLSWVLIKAGMDPSFVVGGILRNLNANSGHGEGDYFVAEGDESDGTFLKYHPYGGIVTNIGFDHMDYYKTKEALITSVQKFCHNVKNPDLLFWCGDCPNLSKLEPVGFSYGFASHNAIRGIKCKQKGWGSSFDIEFNRHVYHDFFLPVPGSHNVLNALAVFGMATQLGVEASIIRDAFATFEGAARRSHRIGSICGITIIDDYAHHTNEIEASLKGIRQTFPHAKLIAVYQPHRYTRVENCRGSYGKAFSQIDHLIVTDIYSAGEKPIEGITPQSILGEIDSYSLTTSEYIPRNCLLEQLVEQLRPHDVLVTLGAGDITHLGSQLLTALKTETPVKLKVGMVTGGRSEEHAIALCSAANVMSGLDLEKYEVSEFLISRKGEWSMPSEEFKKQLMDCDLLMPILHGPFGEDGTIQGFFEMLGKSYVGMNYRAAAIAMDKVLTKQLLVYHGIPTLPFLSVTDHEWQNSREEVKDKIAKELTYPIFVKPTHLGSSIGVHRVRSEDCLDAIMKEAFTHDTILMIENGIKMREIEFAVFGNETITVFPPGEVLSNGNIYDYNGKYGTDGIKTSLDPSLGELLETEGMDLAKRAFQAISGDGMARIDFFLDENQKFWCNEINPIPGFTNISLFPKLCEKHGVPLQELLDTLIMLALSRHRKNRLLRSAEHAHT